MELTVLFFLSSGLFLGWSLGANDAANVFGTAVGSRMVKFATAALICSIFVILGSVISGAGAAHTLSKLGSVNTLPGSFMAALSAAVTVLWMTILGLPVSTTQAIVGGIIGWNFFTDSTTDYTSLTQILGTWIACPLLAAVFSAAVYKLALKWLQWSKLHLLKLDAYTRWSLILVGAFGSYSLGANNIANVVGVFIASNPFTDFQIGGVNISAIQQLFFVGALAISVGVYTYGKKVMLTVGDSLVPLSPVAAFVVVLAESLVLFFFASEDLEHMLASAGLPTIPLVPVSSSQAVVGAVIGIGLVKNPRSIDWKVLWRIVWAWAQTPVIAAFISFVFLFFLQNVFNQQVYAPTNFLLNDKAIGKVVASGIDAGSLASLAGKNFQTSEQLRREVKKLNAELPFKSQLKVIEVAERTRIVVDEKKLAKMQEGWLSEAQMQALHTLAGKGFDYHWEFVDALAATSPEWKLKEATVLNKLANKGLSEKIEFLAQTFTVPQS